LPGGSDIGAKFHWKPIFYRDLEDRLLLLTFTIGLLNLCLGYALAVYLGYGPPGLREAWDALGGRRP
jgi:hypothetical protein